jgi:hypothetical protein
MTQTCEFCKKTGTHTERCPNAGYHVCDPIEDIGPDFQFITQPVIPPRMYMEFCVGQGCAYYVRNNNGTKEIFFLHCDSHGQYGDDTSDIPRYRAFIQGYNKYNHTDD